MFGLYIAMPKDGHDRKNGHDKKNEKCNCDKNTKCERCIKYEERKKHKRSEEETSGSIIIEKEKVPFDTFYEYIKGKMICDPDLMPYGSGAFACCFARMPQKIAMGQAVIFESSEWLVNVEHENNSPRIIVRK